MHEDYSVKVWRIFSFLLTVIVCILCFIFIFIRRKSVHLSDRFPSINLIFVALIRETTVSVPIMINRPITGTDAWRLTSAFCPVYSWLVVYLRSFLSFVLLMNTLHRLLDEKGAIKSHKRLKIVILTISPWIIAFLITLRLLYFAEGVASVVQFAENKRCEISISTFEAIFHLKASNVVLDFLAPAALIAIATIALGAKPSSATQPACRENYLSKMGQCRQNRKIPVILTNVLYIIMRGPHNILMLLFVLQMNIMSKAMVEAWQWSVKIDTTFYYLLPFLWIIQQADMVGGFCRLSRCCYGPDIPMPQGTELHVLNPAQNQEEIPVQPIYSIILQH